MSEEKKYKIESLEDLLELNEPTVSYQKDLFDNTEVEEENNEDGSDDEEEENGKDKKPKYNPKEIDITVSQISLQSIISRLEHGEIDLNTAFQRKRDLWKRHFQSRLIESIMLLLPLPSFYFDGSDRDKWLVVDGLQRLTALDSFINKQAFKLHSLEVLTDYNGMTYDDLPRPMKRRIDDFQVTVYLIKPGTPIEVKYDVFKRINTGGLTLTAQEIRHALNQGIPANYLQNFVYKDLENEVYTENYERFIGVNDERMTGRELILRYIAFFNHNWRKYYPSLLNFLNDEMPRLKKYSDEKRYQLEKQLWKVCGVVQELFGKHAFSKSLAEVEGERKVRRLNSSLFEVWTSQLARLTDQQLLNLIQNKEAVTSDFVELLKDRDFDKSISYSTSSKKHVKTRFSKIEELINQYKNVEKHPNREL